MENVSIVIPTLNGGSLFAELLRRLRSQTIAPRQIVIVDSGSTDSTLAAAREANANILRIAAADFDHGLTRNQGIERSSGEIIILMSQDAVPADDHLIERLIGPFSQPKVAGVFSRQIPRPEHDVITARNLSNWVTGQLLDRVSEITNLDAFNRMPPYDRYMLCIFDNVCSAIRRSVWREIPFRPSRFGEDVEWSKHVLEAGWKIAYQSDAEVIHSHKRSATYEYQRTYLCHRALFRLFGLTTIPKMAYVPQCVLKCTWQDWAYALAHEKSLRRKIPLLLRIPAFACSSVLGQYRGARDERLGRDNCQRGV